MQLLVKRVNISVHACAASVVALFIILLLMVVNDHLIFTYYWPSHKACMCQYLLVVFISVDNSRYVQNSITVMISLNQLKQY